MQVANCTTPANYFHILRRQMHRDFRKPLVIMTPKSLLRHKLAVSSARRLHRREPLPPHPLRPQRRPTDEDVKRLVLCTGKVAYDLMEARDEAGDRTTCRSSGIEQLYPFPGEAAARAPQADDQPRGGGLGAGRAAEQGLLVLVEPPDRAPPGRGRAQAASGRSMPAATAAASPATGLAKRHQAEQAALIADALGHAADAERPAEKPAEGQRMATEVKVPDSGRIDHRGDARRVAQAARRGGRADEPIASLETDKVAVEVPSPVAGVMGEQRRRGGRHGRGRRGDRADRGGRRRRRASPAPGGDRRSIRPVPARISRRASRPRRRGRRGRSHAPDPVARGAPRRARASSRSVEDQGHRQGRPPDQGRRARRRQGPRGRSQRRAGPARRRPAPAPAPAPCRPRPSSGERARGAGADDAACARPSPAASRRRRTRPRCSPPSTTSTCRR